MIAPQREPAPARPRLGFLGVGWIGRNRMQALLNSGLVDIAAISDPSPEMARGAAELAPEAIIAPSFDALIDGNIDGIVIATPSALHAEQSIRALERGVAVFCQKPLGRNSDEVAAVVDAARRADRLLGVDLSYRFTNGMQRIKECITSGELGEIFSADLVFHNAYGPDKPWFYDKALSGGGCVIDLGVHLVDLALWALDFPRARSISSHLMSGGRPLQEGDVEDFAIATIELESGAVIRLTCSWRLQAGQEAIIGASFYGTSGGASFSNVDGSFYDFSAARHMGTSREILADPPDDWGGGAALHWAGQLSQSPAFDPQAEHLVEVARILDSIYKA